MIFPPYVAFSAVMNSSELCLTYVPKGELENCIEISPTAEVPSLIAMFVLERARDTYDLVHIRCCYNNKYWCRDDDNYIVAAAREPVENRNASNCTLFRPTYLNSNVAFTHVGSGRGLATSYDEDDSSWNVVLGRKAASLHLKVVDYEILVRLPTRVVFKGDNGRYLRGVRQKPCRTDLHQMIGIFLPSATGEGIFNMLLNMENEYNQFSSRDGADKSTHYEITHYNGYICIKSLLFGKFLTQSMDGWIWANSNYTTINNRDSMFKVIRLNNNVIALINLGNNKFCTRLTTEVLANCLNAEKFWAAPEANLVVEEPVSYRRLHVEYKLDNARIISNKLIPKNNETRINRSKVTGKTEISFKYQKTRSTKWNRSTTLSSGTKTEFNISYPKYGGAKFELSSHNSESTLFEKGSTSTMEMTVKEDITLPPMSKVILKWYVKEVSYEIPFAYIQTDTYTTGEIATTRVEDGLCHGVETYEHYFEKTETPL